MPVNFVRSIDAQEFDTAILDAAYLIANSFEVEGSISILHIFNDSNTSVIISYDGVNDHDVIPLLTGVTYNLQSNASPQNFEYKIKKGSRVYVRGTAGVGNIYFSGWY